MPRFVAASLDGTKLVTLQQWFDGERWIDCLETLSIEPGTSQTNEVQAKGRENMLYPLRIVVAEEGSP